MAQRKKIWRIEYWTNCT